MTDAAAPAHRRRATKKLPSSFLSSFRIHEALVHDLEVLPGPMLKAFSRWVACFVVVQFDVDIGPDLKIVRPAIRFSEDELRTICFSALPEHTSSMELDNARKSHLKRNRSRHSRQASDLSAVSHADVETQQAFHTFSFHHDSKLLHAFTLFSQRRDPSRTRGYLQESLVIISPYDFAVLFRQCLYTMLSHNNEFLEYSLDGKVPLLDTAINNISQWPDPQYDREVEVGFLGSVLSVLLPSRKLINPLTPDVLLDHWSPTFLPLIPDLADLYTLYECLLLSRPIIIYAAQPQICSSFIRSLVDLIRPIDYADPIREYITIHSFPVDVSTGVTGITNPFLLRGLDPDVSPYAFVLSTPAHRDLQQVEEEKRARAVVKASNRRVMQTRFLHPDPRFMLAASPAAIQSRGMSPNDVDHLVRLHFATLTSLLLSPLTAHLAVNNHFSRRKFLVELDRNGGSAAVDGLFTVQPPQTLMQRLSRASSLLPSTRHSAATKKLFYEKFINSRNFKQWLSHNSVPIASHSRQSSRAVNGF